MKQGRCYAAETSAVTVSFTANASGRTAGPGEELPLGVFDAVEVTAVISGVPNTVALLYTQWGVMASVPIGPGGTGRLTWKGWGKASFFARLEVRRLQPAWTVLTQMVAVTNPIWFYSATPVNQPAPIRTPGVMSPEVPFYGGWNRRAATPGFDSVAAFNGTRAALDGTLYQSVGQWSALTRYSAFTPVPGPDGAERWAATKIAAAGGNDNSVKVLVYGVDGTMYLNNRKSDGSYTGWIRLAGHGSTATFSGSDLAVIGSHDGGCEIAAIGTDGLVYHQVYKADGRSDGFVRMKGVDAPTMGAVSVAIASQGDTTYFAAVRPDGTVWVTRRDPDDAWEPWEQTVLPATERRAVGKVLLFPATTSVQVMAFTAG